MNTLHWSFALSCLLTCAGCWSGSEDASTADGKRQPYMVPNTEQRVITASDSGRQYQIFIAAPKQPPGRGGSPVIYVLDGNTMFLTAMEAARAYERRHDSRIPNAALVVGIGYPPGVDHSAERGFDLTPTQDANAKHRTGGAQAFQAFIENDLKPAIARDYRVDHTRQTLMGHSLAGMFVLDTAIRHPQAFQTYVAMSSSFWFGDHAILPRIDAFVAQRKTSAAPLRVLLTVGEYEQLPRPGVWDSSKKEHPRRRRATLDQRGQVTHARATAQKLASAPATLIDFQEITGEDHGTVIPASISKGLEFILAGPVAVPAVPNAQQYLQLGPQGRYRLRMQVRALPDLHRIPWLRAFQASMQAGLDENTRNELRQERLRMDQHHGSQRLQRKDEPSQGRSERRRPAFALTSQNQARPDPPRLDQALA